MAVLLMRRYGDPILRQKPSPVEAVTPEIRRMIADFVETMHHEIGVGLAAPQVGVPLRLCVMDDGSGHVRALINPTIIERGGSMTGEEGCLSLPGIFSDVERSAWVRVEAIDEEGRPVSLEYRGFSARVVQHEVDHLNGVLFIDHLPPVARDRIKKRIQKEGFSPPSSRRALAL
jgi:peptide deformylase